LEIERQGVVAGQTDCGLINASEAVAAAGITVACHWVVDEVGWCAVAEAAVAEEVVV
jgi:hypothetical protein